jgi:hypothetical protein
MKTTPRLTPRQKRIEQTQAAADHYFGLVHASCSLQEFVALKLSCGMPEAGRRITEAGGINYLRAASVTLERQAAAVPVAPAPALPMDTPWFVLVTVPTLHGRPATKEDQERWPALCVTPPPSLVGPFTRVEFAMKWRDERATVDGTMTELLSPVAP